MTQSCSRRNFLRTCQAAAAVAATGSLSGSFLRAVEPIERNGTAKFKFSLAAYSYRNLLKGKDAALTLTDFVNDCARMQLEGTELTSYYFPTPVTREYLVELRRQCFRLGLDVSGTAVGNDFGFPAGEKRTAQIESLKQWIEHAAVLGAPVIRVFAGHQQAGIAAEETHRLIVSALEECCQHAGQHGVHLALENHGGPTSTAAGLLALVRDVNSPWFGVNLDTGNFHSDQIYEELEQVAPYALNVQVKVTVADSQKVERPADLARLAKMLRATGYRGYIVLEYEENDDPRQACPAFIDQIRAAFA